MATLPPDTRAAGTPDPANDMNSVVDCLSVISGATPGGGVVTTQQTINTLAGAVTNHQVLAGNGSNITLRGLTSADVPTVGNIFGDASDGAITFDGQTDYTSSPNGGLATKTGSSPNFVYTLTRDVFATNCTISSGKTVNPAGFRIFCQGTFTNNGMLQYLGNAANLATAGGNTVRGSFNVGGAGAAGVTGAGAAANAPTGSVGTGAGGNGGTAPSGGVTAGASPVITSTWPYRLPTSALSGLLISQAGAASNATVPAGGVGGSSGAGDGTHSGGAGGGGGGLIGIFAWTAINSAGSTISTLGGAGGNGGASGNCGGGGGGGGGAVLVYSLSAWTQSGTVTVAGGAAGTATGNGSNGTAGGSGSTLNVVLA